MATSRKSAAAGLSNGFLESLYTTMIRIRRFDERAAELFKEGRVKGTAHSYVGEEAIGAAAGASMLEHDSVVSNHRGHGHCIAKGARLDKMMAELFGTDAGYCRGLGGSMHIADLDSNIYGANGIVGAGMGIGTGAALAAKIRGDDSVGVCFFGDGASNEGMFHETMNMASIWKLPIVFVCENNDYALSTKFANATSVDKISKRAAGYGIPGVTVDGNDVIAVHEVMSTAIARARAGEGPSMVEALTYRWNDHSMRANLPRYRAEDEEEAWRKRDPVKRLEGILLDRDGIDETRLGLIRAEIEDEIEGAIAFAEKGAQPTVEMMEAAVYAPHEAHLEPAQRGSREITYAEALNEAMGQEMERDERVFVMGEDVAGIGGIFGSTRGLLDRFGPARVRDTPMSEMGFSGAGVGAAAAGMRPIVEIQIFDFVTYMMDAIVNQAAKFRYMLGGKPTVPIVFRGPQGGGIRLAAQHSQSLEAWFNHVPGLVVIAPSTPYDAKGLLTAAIRDDNPVMFLEHKLLYLGDKAAVPEEPYAIPIGKAAVMREGGDVTVVATQIMVERSLSAALQLEREGIAVEVIDPRTLRPLDEETILASVRKTHRLIVAHEAPKTGGYGGEIAALVAEKAFDYLDAPIVRVGGREVPMPYNDELERAAIPQINDIVDAIRRVCEGM